MIFACTLFPLFAFGKEIPRTIYAFYDDKVDKDLWYSYIHQYAAMPLEYLGLRIVYKTIHEEFPQLSSEDGVRGLLMWQFGTLSEEEREKWIDYLLEAQKLGKKVVVFDGNYLLDFPPASSGLEKQKEFFKNLGLRYEQG